MQIYSNAFNFDSYLQGGVDLRTGQYNCRVNLVTLYPEGAAEDSRDIALSFSMMSLDNLGYGIGWDISTAEYDEQTRRLRLLSGEMYTTLPLVSPGNLLTFTDRRLADLAVRRIDIDTLHVIHKNGVVEVLVRHRPGTRFLLQLLIFENGERFRFSHTSEDLLSSVNNELTNRIVLSLVYNNRMLSSATALRENGRQSRVHFTAVNNRMMQITVPLETNAVIVNAPRFSFEYQLLNGYLCMTSMSNPMGGQDLATYDASGHQVRSNVRLPVVRSLTVRTGDAASSMLHQYTYSQNNFSGFPLATFDDAADNLYQHLTPYEYWARDQLMVSGAVAEEQQITFNRFHLPVLERVSRSGVTTEKHYQYNENLALPFGQQPENLHLPRQIETIYRRGNESRTETEKFGTDRFGNQLLHTTSSGIQKAAVYYPAAGMANRCPPEPHGLFERFLQLEQVLPAAAASGDKSISHTYVAIAGLSLGLSFIRRAGSTSSGNVTETFDYVQMPSDAVLHGRLREARMTLNGLATRTEYSYQRSQDQLTETRRVVGYDNNALTSQRTISTVTQLLLSLRKNDAVAVNFTYDLLGRVVTETVSPNTANSAQRRHIYQFSNGAQRAQMETVDVMNNRYVRRYDGLGRLVSIDQVRANGEIRLQTKAYDQMGRLASMTQFDYLGTQSLQLLTRYEYDGWGQVSQTVRPGGRVEVNSFDPIQRVRIQGVSGAVTVRRVENQYGKTEREELVASNGSTSFVSGSTYDGFGRRLTMTDSSGGQRRYTYDLFDRIVTEVYTPSGGTARTIQKTYASHAVEALPERISVAPNTVLGIRKYDGVGRLLSEARGNSTVSTVYTYAPNMTMPATKRLPSGTVLNYQYDMQLEALREISSNNQRIAAFSMKADTGALQNASNSEFTRDLAADEYGRVIEDTQRFQNQSHSSSYQYSTAGRLEKITSAVGDVESYSYDYAGRLSELNSAGVRSVFSYDSSGRIRTISCSANNNTLLTTVSYDLFSRESSRTITRNGVMLQTIGQTYHANHKIASRSYTGPGNALLASETFAYDAYGRLSQYSCAGSQYPADSSGRLIHAQQFSYDDLNNLTRVQTNFGGAESDVSIRTYGNAADPTQLRQVTHTSPVRNIVLSYDANGNLNRDETREYGFNALSQLSSVRQSGGIVATYGYDASGRLSGQSDAAGNTATLHYAQNRLIGLRQSSATARYLRHEQTVLARSLSGAGTEVNGSDASDSARTVIEANQAVRNVQYAPYGLANVDGTGSGTLLERSRPAFNGERYDPLGRIYHPGNGRRAYSPELMSFLSPDPLSPFGAGGLNAYGYCGGDPVNFRDLNGLWSMPLWLGWTLLTIGAMVTAGAFGVAVIGAAGMALVTKLILGASVVSLGFSAAALSLETLDTVTGSDHGQIIYALNVASGVFGAAALFSGLGAAGRVVQIRALAARRRPSGSYFVREDSGQYVQRTYLSSVYDWNVLKRGGQGAVEGLFTYRTGGQGFSWIWGVNLGTEVVGLPLDVFSVLNAVDEAVKTYPYETSGADKPVAGVSHGMLEGSSAFFAEFSYQSERLRSSAMLDF